MDLNITNEIPIFLQIASLLEDEIITGAYAQGTQIPSTTEISMGYKINPATVLKGMNLLVDEGVIYKKRGVGMFVADGAVELIRDKRRAQFADKYIRPMLDEARKIGLSVAELKDLIKESDI